jgi:hypothetical protein
VLDAEPDPAAKPQHVDVDERHRSGEGRDRVGDSILHALGSSASVLDEDRVRLEQLDMSHSFQENRLFCGHPMPPFKADEPRGLSVAVRPTEL